MCGIAGIFGYRPEAPPVSREELLAVRESMRRRGPDGEGLWVAQDGRVGLAHRRLSIIDVSDAGLQPMVDRVTGNQIVFNGEIYNHRKLRQELERDGTKFESGSDTEVILRLYARDGARALGRLRGMYAFAIWDQRKCGLLLARDPLGIKPLYLADDGQTVRFASQVKALLAGRGVDTSMEPAGHVGYFLLGYVPEPFSLYKGVRMLPAGSHSWFQVDRPPVAGTHFDLSEELRSPSLDLRPVDVAEAAEMFRDAVRESVRHHLVADVPVGLFLSSGVDSTALAFAAVRSLVAGRDEGGTPHSLRSVTLAFNEYRGTGQDESTLAEIVARSLGLQHETVWLPRGEVEECLADAMATMDQPSVDGINSYMISKVAHAAGLKVVISGLGGDELLGGYQEFIRIPKLVRNVGPFSRLPVLPKAFRVITSAFFKQMISPKYAGIFEYGGDIPSAFLLRRGLFMPWELPKLMDAAILREGWTDLQILPAFGKAITGLRNDQDRIRLLLARWYMRCQLLRDTDWASMAHSLEVRVPLVDVELWKVANALSARGYPQDKRSLATLIDSEISQTIARRPKSGFTVPLNQWKRASAVGKNRFLNRGLRPWSTIVYAGATAGGSSAIKALRPPVLGLLAPSLYSRGGVQTFMCRLAEIMGGEAAAGRAQQSAACPLRRPPVGIGFSLPPEFRLG